MLRSERGVLKACRFLARYLLCTFFASGLRLSGCHTDMHMRRAVLLTLDEEEEHLAGAWLLPKEVLPSNLRQYWLRVSQYLDTVELATSFLNTIFTFCFAYQELVERLHVPSGLTARKVISIQPL